LEGRAGARSLAATLIPPFEQAAVLWEPDGSLRDIYFLDTGLADWRRFVEAAREHGASYAFNGQSRHMPPVHQVLANREGSHLLTFTVCGVVVNCHFFAPEEIELDVSPKEVKERYQHEALLRFVADLSVAIGKRALVTPENLPDAPILSFDPSSRSWAAGG
jgi:hypothetical protein